MLKKIAHFSTGTTYSGFSENEDGSITKSALVFVEGSHQDNRGRSWNCSGEFVEKLVENTNRAFNEGKHIPILKEHTRDLNSEIGSLNAPLEVRVITEEDLPDPRLKNLIGKVGAFNNGLVIQAKDVVENIKRGLNKKLSPGVDMANVVIKEISSVVAPAITGLAMYSEGTMDGVFTLDDADAMSQDDEQLEEEFEDLSKKFFCVLKNIMNNEEQLGENAGQMVEKAFEDYEMRLRDLFGLTGEIPEEDETVGDTQRNGYSLQDAPGMVPQNDYAPYSLYASDDDAEFAGWFDPLKNLAKGYAGGVGVVKNAAQDVFKPGAGMKAGRDRLKNYFTKVGAPVMKDGRMSMGASTMRWGRVGKAAGAVAGTGAAGYGAYKLGRAGLGAVGIGRKEEKPWYRRNPFN